MLRGWFAFTLLGLRVGVCTILVSILFLFVYHENGMYQGINKLDRIQQEKKF